MANRARDFAIELDREFQEEVGDKVVQVVQKIALETLSRVVLKTPVDSGRARGSWTVSIDIPSDDVPERLDPSGSQAINAGTSVITGLRDLNSVWVQSNLPYIGRLENGWSAQAPSGMVAVTLVEIEAMFARID